MRVLASAGLVCLLAVAACDDGGMSVPPTSAEPLEPRDPATAQRVDIDRFSAQAGTLMVRTADNGLPEAGQPVDFDQAPFITTGLGPQGSTVRYYNFDVQPEVPAPIYVFFEEGADTPIADQLNVIDAVPGDAGYSDFWRVHRVTVPADYVANTVTSLAGIVEAGLSVEAMPMLVNCPVVPEGSTATLRHGDGESSGLTQGWYKDQAVFYFSFMEAPLAATDDGTVPTSPIYVSFNMNPDQPGGGPPSGFVTEDGSEQTHNVLGTLPADIGYSPLWDVHIYDNADFDIVSNLLTAATATNVLVESAALVNCPVVEIVR